MNDVTVEQWIWITVNAYALLLSLYLLGKRLRDWRVLRADALRAEHTQAQRELTERALLPARYTAYRRSLHISVYLLGLLIALAVIRPVPALAEYLVWALIAMPTLVFVSDLLEELQERRSNRLIDRQLHEEREP